MENIRPIRTEDDYNWAIAEITKYFENEPEVGSPDGDRFDFLATLIEAYEEKPNLTRISAVILTEKKSHKGIIIGKDGHTLKGIGKSARMEIEALLGVRVFLELWVKVRENWRDDGRALSSLGYTPE
jgi:hypothetical protein